MVQNSNYQERQSRTAPWIKDAVFYILSHEKFIGQYLGTTSPIQVRVAEKVLGY